MRLVSQRRQLLLFGAKGSELGGGIGQLAEAPAQVAFYAMAGDPLSHQGDRVDACLLQIPHAVLAHVPGEAVDVVADATDQLAAVAPTGTPAHAPAFEQHHRQAVLGEFQRSVDPCQATADDAHIGIDVALQVRVAGGITGSGRIVGRGMFGR